MLPEDELPFNKTVKLSFKGELIFGKAIQGVRIEKACELLRETDISVATVAKRVGFNSANYFYRVFKQWVGMTPTQYREECRAEPARG